MRFLIICTVVLALTTGAASAQENARPGRPLRAGSLYAACTHSLKDAQTPQSQAFLEHTCTTYFLGLTDALLVMQALANVGTRTCLPANGTLDTAKARTIFQNFVHDHPETATRPAGLVAPMALVNAFTCGGGQ